MRIKGGRAEKIRMGGAGKYACISSVDLNINISFYLLFLCLGSWVATGFKERLQVDCIDMISFQ